METKELDVHSAAILMYLTAITVTLLQDMHTGTFGDENALKIRHI